MKSHTIEFLIIITIIMIKLYSITMKLSGIKYITIIITKAIIINIIKPWRITLNFFDIKFFIITVIVIIINIIKSCSNDMKMFGIKVLTTIVIITIIIVIINIIKVLFANMAKILIKACLNLLIRQ